MDRVLTTTDRLVALAAEDSEKDSLSESDNPPTKNCDRDDVECAILVRINSGSFAMPDVHYSIKVFCPRIESRSKSAVGFN